MQLATVTALEGYAPANAVDDVGIPLLSLANAVDDSGQLYKTLPLAYEVGAKGGGKTTP